MYILSPFINTAIDQVTGVTLTCEPVGLAIQCTVMWNVSYCHLYVCIYSYFLCYVYVYRVYIYICAHCIATYIYVCIFLSLSHKEI